jgi:small conductance mechanosensitive channel
VTESFDWKAMNLGTAIRVAVLIVVGVIVIRALLTIVDRMLERSGSLKSLKVYIHSVVNVLLWFLLILMVAGSLSIDVTSIIALLSVAGLAVSLALQNTLSNLAGGIVLLVSKPFVVGDYVEAEGISGTVAAIDLAYTSFTTPDNKEIFIPNSQIAAAKVINYNRLGRRRVDLNFTASYDAPTKTVKAAIQDVLDGESKILRDPAPAIWISEYQSSSIQYVVRVWTAADDYWDVYYAIQEGVRESFAKHGVEMTYDHLNVHLLQQ